MRISVAIATYNGLSYLPEQLRSIASQSLRPHEIIIVDDRSSDTTLRYLTEIQSTYPIPLSVYSNTHNIGFQNTFLRALSHCSGDIVFLSDQDDVWLPDKVSTVVSYIRANPTCHLVQHDSYVTDSTLRITHQSLFKAMNLPIQHFSYGFCMAVSKELISHLPQTLPIGHDHFLNYLANMFHIKGFINQPLCLYRRHPNTTSQSLQTSAPSRPHFLEYNLLAHFNTLDFYRALIQSASALNATLPDVFYQSAGISKIHSKLTTAESRYHYMCMPVPKRYFCMLNHLFRGYVPFVTLVKDFFSTII